MAIDYFTHNGKRFEISEETARELAIIFGGKSGTKLGEIEVSKTFKLGDYEFIVLEHTENGTAVILKDLLYENEKFGSNNNYDGSNVDELCNAFEKTLASIIGEENIYTHKVDLTAINGMICYGSIERKVSLLTVERMMRYGCILAGHKLDKYWWLATANGTLKCGTDNYALCVAPSGHFYCDGYCGSYGGVRPFCILKSNIVVSK